MNLLRSILYMAFMVITVIPYALVCVLWAPLPLRWRYALTTGWPRMCLWAARWIVGIRYQVIGMDKLPDGPLIILSKHQSAWETLFFASQMPRDVVFVYKKELHRIPFFGWGLALLSMIPIDRRKGRESFEQVAPRGQQSRADGRSPTVFPEGTRVRGGPAGRSRLGGAPRGRPSRAPAAAVAPRAGA